MMLHEITEKAGAHKRRKRRGRGESSGLGRTSGRGNKGCLSRSGGGPRPLSEGGQMPIFRRLPKRGFSNVNFRTEYDVVNLGELSSRFAEGEHVSPEALRKSRLIRGASQLVKILATGSLDKKLTVEAHAFSTRAREAIEKAGGTAKLIERRSPAAAAKAKRGTAKARRKAGAAAGEAKSKS